MTFAVPRALPLSLMAALVLAGCAEKGAAPLKKGEKPVDVASVVRQKMPASVKDRNAWADALAKTFESQKIAPTEENICSVLAVAQQESMYQSDPAVPGLNKIAWKEIDRRAESMHIPVFLVHTALKITSPNGKSYSERLDSVKTEKQLSAIFDDFIGSIRTLPVTQHHLRPFYAQLTRLARRHFVVVVIYQFGFSRRHRQANAAAVIIDIVRVDAHQRRAFRQAVAFKQILTGQFHPAIGNGLLHRHTAASGKMQRGEIQRAELFIVQQRVK